MVRFLFVPQCLGGGKLIKLVAMVLLVNSVQNTIAWNKDGDGVGDGEDNAETAKAIREWSQLTSNMLTASFGFLSPPGSARAVSMVMTAEWNAFAPFTPDMTPVVVARFPDEPDPELLQVERLPRDEVEVRKAVSIAAFLTLAEIFDPTIPCSGEGAAARNLAFLLLETEGLDLLEKYAFIEADSVADAVDQLLVTSDEQTIAGQTTKRTIAFLESRRNDGINSRELNYVDKWQALRVPTPDGGSRLGVPWLAPYMSRVIPFTDETSVLWQMLDPPPEEDDPEFLRQHSEVLSFSSVLDDREKIVAEYWTDGPARNLPPGHWHDIAIEVTEINELNADDTLHLLFLQANAVFDAGIAAWTAKRFYDSARPITAIQCLFEGQQVQAWQGPYQGVGTIDASNWLPYQAATFVTPPFAEFVSGHSTFSAASAFVMRTFLGSDEWGGSYTVMQGESKFEPRIDIGNPGYIPGITDVANQGPATIGFVPRGPIVLSWPTFTDAATEAGVSRLFGGVNIVAGNEAGLALGDKVGEVVWKRYQGLLNGDDGDEPDKKTIFARLLKRHKKKRQQNVQ